MTQMCTRLGIDVGSVSLAVVEIDAPGILVERACAPHRGRIEETARELLGVFDLGRVGWVRKTSSTPELVSADRTVENNVAAMTAAKVWHPDLRALLVVGGE